MKSTIENLGNLKKRIQVEITKDKVNAVYGKVFNKFQQQAELKGFRKGKAPLSMIKKVYGDRAAYEVGDQIIRDFLFSAIQEHNLKIADQPKLETEKLPNADEDYTFSAVFEVFPEINLKEHKNITITVPKFEYKEEMLEQEMNRIKEMFAEMTPVDSGIASEGMQATFDQHGEAVGADPHQHCDDPAHDHNHEHHHAGIPDFHAHDMKIVIGKKTILPELEQALLGMNTGEEKKVALTLPNDYQNKDLAGKDVTVTLILKDLKNIKLPELNDEFAQKHGAKDLEDFKTKITGQLHQRLENQRRQHIEEEAMKHFREQNPLEVPDSVVDNVIDNILRQEFHWLKDHDMEHLMNNQEMRDNVRELAVKRAQNTLLLIRLADQENIQVNQEEIENQLATQYRDFRNLENKNPKAKLRLVQDEVFNQRIKQAINKILDSAKIIDL